MATTVNNISQEISVISEAGHRGVDGQTVFVTKQEAFQDDLTETFVPEINTLRSQFNTTTSQMANLVDEVNAVNAELESHYVQIDNVSDNMSTLLSVDANKTDINTNAQNIDSIKTAKANADSAYISKNEAQQAYNNTANLVDNLVLPTEATYSYEQIDRDLKIMNMKKRLNYKF